jgi:hypothetical protein
MLVSFTQTYGNDRSKLHEIYSVDKRMIELKNLFDINIHSFHNCNHETITNYKKLNKVNNSMYLEFNNISYPKTIGELKNILKDIGCTHFFFSQDDTFSADNDNIDWKELITYLKEQDSNFMMNLCYNTDLIDIRIKPFLIKNTFNVYYTSSFNFRDISAYSMDDSPYMCTIDFIDIIYDNIYINEFKSVWDSERYLNKKFSNIEIPRYLLSDYGNLFKNYNMFGNLTAKKEIHIKELKAKNLYW